MTIHPDRYIYCFRLSYHIHTSVHISHDRFWTLHQDFNLPSITVRDQRVLHLIGQVQQRKHFTKAAGQSFSHSQAPKESEWDRCPTGHPCLSNTLSTMQAQVCGEREARGKCMYHAYFMQLASSTCHIQYPCVDRRDNTHEPCGQDTKQPNYDQVCVIGIFFFDSIIVHVGVQNPMYVTFLPNYLILSHYLTAYHWDCRSFILSPIPSTVRALYHPVTCLSGLVIFYLVR
jgi:hypothetical protein